MTDVMINAEGLVKRYGAFTALSGATFQVKRGEVVGFLGPNGAGKSTTMKILTCFIAPSEGRAQINGFDIWDNPLEARAAVGYLPESTPLYSEMHVGEFLEFMGQVRGLDKDTLKKRVKKVVEETSLGDVFGKVIRTLSKGYRQRVGLAQALVHEPPILILDEPMSGLDPNQAVEIRDLIKELGKERTVLLSTHNLSEVEVTCQRVLIISKGKLVADDTPKDLRSKAKGSRSYEILVRKGDTAKAKEILAGKPWVSRIADRAAAVGEEGLSIVLSDGADHRVDLFETFSKGAVPLLELRTREQNLEDVFRDLTLDTSKDSKKSESAKSESTGVST